MTRLGPILPDRACGFSRQINEVTCGQPSVLHAWFVTDGNDDYAFACRRHAPALTALADLVHPVEEPCTDDGAWWLTRPDGSSFCYHPDTEAALQAELAAGSTARRLQTQEA